jgi:hypothetical protein
MMRLPFAQLSLLPRATAIGCLAAGITGGIVGLILGLIAYAPTAPVGILELGIPSALVGAAAGLTTGAIILALRRFDHPHGP